MRIELYDCSDCKRKDTCTPAKWHWEGDAIIIDKDGTLCVLNPNLKPQNMQGQRVRLISQKGKWR